MSPRLKEKTSTTGNTLECAARIPDWPGWLGDSTGSTDFCDSPEIFEIFFFLAATLGRLPIRFMRIGYRKPIDRLAWDQ